MCRPAIEILRIADVDVPSTGKIYWQCEKLHEHAKDFAGLSAQRRKTVKDLVRRRWDMLTTDLHCAGYMLDPEFQDHNVDDNEVCLRLQLHEFNKFLHWAYTLLRACD